MDESYFFFFFSLSSLLNCYTAVFLFPKVAIIIWCSTPVTPPPPPYLLSWLWLVFGCHFPPTFTETTIIVFFHIDIPQQEVTHPDNMILVSYSVF